MVLQYLRMEWCLCVAYREGLESLGVSAIWGPLLMKPILLGHIGEWHATRGVYCRLPKRLPRSQAKCDWKCKALRVCFHFLQNAADQPLLVTSSTGVTITNNLFDSVLCYPYAYGAAQSFIPLPQPPIFLAFASNLRVVNNTYNIPANCTYGNFSSPIQTLGGTVTGLSLT